MPINISDLTQNETVAAVYSPKFFSQKLTGAGRNQGLLTQRINPGSVKTVMSLTPSHVYIAKRQTKNGDTTVYHIPFNVLTADLWEFMTNYTPDDKTMVARANIGNHANPNKSQTNFFLDVRTHSVIMEERPNDNGIGQSRKISPCYQVFLYAETDPSNKNYKLTQHSISTAMDDLIYGTSRTTNTENRYAYTFTTDLRQTLEQIRVSLDNRGYADYVMLTDYLDSFSIYHGICRESEIWQTSCDKIIEQLCKNIAHTNDSDKLNKTADMLAKLEQYPIPLDLYRQIYHIISTNFIPKTANTLCKQNLNLLLNDTLYALNSQINNLSTIPNPSTPLNSKLPLSRAQHGAVTTTAPLTLIQAGAGSGKSSVILERINWMIQAGVKPEDITVISFTNAAADNITEKQPFVHSMTSCAMINTIYMENFPEHKLNTMESLASTLQALYRNPTQNPKDYVALQFAKHLDNMVNHRSDRSGSNPQTKLNNFIEAHLQEVLDILTEIHQTTLELQIIICYQMINQLTEPASTLTKYLIIDEVQDNSVFEFIYFLRYAAKHASSLFMVGEPLQLPTLNPTNCGNHV